MTPASLEIAGLEILGPLASGGMGDVMLARHHGAHGFEKLVAVKTIRSDLAAVAHVRAMFLDEARLVARLHHPSIAQVIDCGDTGEVMYLVMEYVAGVSLATILDQYGPLSPVFAARVVADVCHGLHYAHELRDAEGQLLGVVHRDVSPDNVLLTFEGHVKILDFGIAWTRDRLTPATEAGQIKGKPLYMAPEQLLGGRIDRRTDVHGAGLLLFELLTNTRPFERSSEIATAMATVEEAAPSVRSRRPDVPAELDAIILRALSKDPEERFPDARAMATALEKLIEVLGGASLPDLAEVTLAADRVDHRERIGRLMRGEGSVPARFSLGPPDTVPSLQPPALPPVISPITGAGDHTRYGLTWLILGAVALTASLAIAWVAIERQRARAAGSQAESLPEAELPPEPETLAAGEDAGVRPKKKRKRHPKRVVAPSRAVERPTERALLSVDAIPFAIVHVDGKKIGTTPVVRLDLSAGKHVLELTSPENGTRIARREIVLRPGQELRATFP